jgi:hypothetical protein
MIEIDDAADRLVDKLLDGLTRGSGVSALVLGSAEPVAVVEAKSVGRLIEMRTVAGASFYIRETALLGIVVTAGVDPESENEPFRLDDGTEILSSPEQ